MLLVWITVVFIEVRGNNVKALFILNYKKKKNNNNNNAPLLFNVNVSVVFIF